MIEDALAGKIDLIVTKSVSRFARNTVDSLTTVRKLKDKGVEVYFEKENIFTLDFKGELLITIMSSLAQEESRSISENTTWGQRKRFADGIMSLGYRIFLDTRRALTPVIWRLLKKRLSSFAEYIESPLTRRPIPNRGELPQFLVEDVLPAIIPREEWLAVQELRKRHSGAGLRQNEDYPFTNMLVCPYCGKMYGSYASATHNRELVY